MHCCSDIRGILWDKVGFGLSAKFVYVSVTVVLVLCRCAGRHCLFVVPSELAFSATWEETCISFTFRFLFMSMGDFLKFIFLTFWGSGDLVVPPPPWSWGRTFLLIREANPSPRISLHFPPAGGPSPSLAILSSNQSMSSRPSNLAIEMGKSRLTLGNGSHCDPFFHMKNTLHQTSYVVPVGVGTADLATVSPRNTLVASRGRRDRCVCSEFPCK